MRLERNNDAIGGVRPTTSSPGAAYRRRQVLLVVALGASILVSACGGRVAAPADNAARPPSVATAAAISGDAGPIPTIDFTERMPTFAAIPTQELGPSPVELVRRIDVPSPNLGGMAVDPDGNIYVSSKHEARILKYSRKGELLLTWVAGTPDVATSLMAMDGRGNVYISASDNYIQKYDPNGKFLLKWGGTGTGEGQFNGVGGMAIDRHGNYYIVDRENQRVQKFDSNRKFLLMWGGAGSGDGEFEAPGGTLVDMHGNVYVSDYAQGTVQKFDSNGRFLLKWGGTGTGEGQFMGHVASAVDSHGDVYVADVEGHRIQVFDPNGKFLSQWNHSGGEPLVYPEGVAIDRKGYIYVREDSHARDARIHIFRPRK